MREYFNFNLISVFLFAFVLFLAGCKEEPIPEQIPDEIVEEIPEADEINRFVWEGLATYYYWVQDIPNLVNGKFNNEDSLNYFLNQYTDPEQLFYSLLYKYDEVDRWSFIVDDSKEIDDWLTGISESMGFDFMLDYIGDTDDLYGFVRYVTKDSPADLAGIRRGDFFMEVNGTQITVSNYQSLLFSQAYYTLNMAQVDNFVISTNGISHDLTAVILQENPILKDTILMVDGMKVGYLVYNGFTSAYDEKLGTSYDILLNSTFGKFKSEGIHKLVIDLRYNGGGSVQTAGYLASMIYSTDKNSVFAKYKYNGLLQNYFQEEYGEDYFNEYFTDVIGKESWDTRDNNGNITGAFTTPETPINNLNLSELYVITSSNTASASELLINGLESYIDVKHYGTNTTGKNVGSFTIRDWDEDGIVNPDHKWAMQPITLKIANSDNFSEYINGLVPDVFAEEDITNLLPLGDPNELLLETVLNDMRGIATKSAVFNNYAKPFKSSREMNRFNKEMYIDPGKFLKFEMK